MLLVWRASRWVTVSAVVNGKQVVRPLVVARVEDAMKALNFHPDHVGISLCTSYGANGFPGTLCFCSLATILASLRASSR